MDNYYIDLGTVDYNKCLELQYKLVDLRKEHKIKNTVLFLEHNDVYTIGRKADINNYKNVNVVKTDRGGDVTFHGKGQLVTYFIFDVNINGKREIRKFLEKIENSYIDMLKKNNYDAFVGDEPGIFININNEKRKVASIGLAIKDNISYHGVALNISKEILKGFNLINPCGMNNNVMYYADIKREKAINDLLVSMENYFGTFEKINIDKIIY